MFNQAEDMKLIWFQSVLHFKPIYLFFLWKFHMYHWVGKYLRIMDTVFLDLCHVKITCNSLHVGRRHVIHGMNHHWTPLCIVHQLIGSLLDLVDWNSGQKWTPQSSGHCVSESTMISKCLLLIWYNNDQMV